MDSLQLDIILRLIISAILGAILGFEREYIGKSAGLRTYMLVSLGSTLFTILSLDGLESYIGISSLDPSRVISQIVVGVGFIGAGLIIFQEKEGRVYGLTTAAGLWAIAGIGCAVGLKYYFIAVFTTLFILIVLSGSRYFDLEVRIHRLSDRRNKNIDSNSQ